MKAQLLAEGVYCIGLDINTEDLFEGIWPVPQGVSLNCFLVRGEQCALIDLVRDCTSAPLRLEAALAETGVSPSSIDYLILNHLEPDHSGFLAEFREKAPQVQIISTAKGINLVKSFYKITQGLRAVKDGDTLDLGAGRVLSFIETPNIPWPETMCTWDPQSGTLFSCDAFGSFGALGDRIFDDQFSEDEHRFFEAESLRYYANIVSTFSPFVERGIGKLAEHPIKAVAPSHGIVWRAEPQRIIERYLRYAGYARKGEPEIAVIWGSMYGNTRLGLDAVLRGIAAEGVPYTIHRVPDENASYVLSDAYRSAALVLAMPTYEYAMFPPMAYILDLFRRKHVLNKTVLRIGSWGWVGGAEKEYKAAIEGLNWTGLESHEWAGAPTDEDLRLLEERGRELARRVKSPA
jgi:flavorubredoxin